MLFSSKSVRVAVSVFLIGFVFSSAARVVSAAQLTATWNPAINGGDGVSYNDPANWDINQVPINNVSDTFVVVIPASANITFNVPGVGNAVDELSLAGGSSLTMASPLRELAVLGATSWAGTITADDGSFTANAATAMFAGSPRMFARNGGDIAFGANTVTSTFSGAQTIYESVNPGSTIDLSSLGSMTINENTSFGDVLTIRAADSGSIDLSSLTSASSNDLLRFLIESGGSIDLSALNTTQNVEFDVAAGSYTLTSLATATATRFDLGASVTVNADALTTQSGGSYDLQTNATVNLGSLASLSSTSITVAAGGNFNAPNLTDFQGNTVTLRPDFTFTTGSLANIDNSRFFVEGGKVFNAVSATSYTSAFATDSITVMSADGTGSLLDLSSLTSLTVNETTSFTDTMTISATNGGTIDLSGVTAASSSDVLQFLLQSGGDIDLSALDNATRVRFNVDNASYTLPALATASSTQFDAATGTTINANALTSQTGGSYTLDTNATVNVTGLASLSGTTITVAAGGTFNAPNLTDFQGNTVTLRPDFTFTTGTLANIDGSRFFVEGGKVFSAVSATSYTSSFATDSITVMSSDGSGSLLDLSSLTSLTVNETTSFTDTMTIRASNSGVIDLSSVTSAQSSDILRFQVQSGGDIDLDALQSTTRVTFDIDVPTYTLPALQTVSSNTLDVATGSTLNLPALTTATSTTFTIATGGALVAPNLTDFQGNTVTLRPDFTFTTGPLANIDNTRLFVEGGKVFDTVSAASYNASFNTNSITVMSSDGSGSLLDLSSLTSMTVNEVSSFTDTVTIHASNSGVVDLSSLTSAQSNDILRFLVQSGGDIDLDALQSTTRVEFEIDVPSYTLPALQTAASNTFDVANGSTLNLPVLTAATSSTFTVENGGALIAPNLTDITGSTMTLTPGFTFTTGALTNVNGARFFIQSGKVFDSVSAIDYTTTLSNSQTFMQADGTGSKLDLSTLTSMVVNENTSFGDVLTVRASNEGVVDLSSVVSASSNDLLEFLADSNGRIDLGSLNSATNVRFRADSGGVVSIGALSPGDGVAISVTDGGSRVEASGSLALGTTSTVSVGNGGELHVAGNFSHEQRTEANINLDAAVLQMDGSGGQLFEAASEDLGLPGPGSGNFGIGQMVIGRTEQRTSVSLRDVIDNGNRGGGGEAEALYLYGLGGPDGLRILNNSALVLNGINVYAWDAATTQMVHLNALFTGPDLRLPFDDGFIQLVPLDFQWDNILGGDFNVPTNWNDNIVPLGSDSAVWNLGSVGGYAVLFGTNVATDAAIIKTDKVTYDLGGFTYTNAALNATTGVIVGQDAADNGSLTVINGTLASPSVRVAAAVGSTGELIVGSGGTLDVSDTLTLGPGTATVDPVAGGEVLVADTLDLGPSGTFDAVGGFTTVGDGPASVAAGVVRVNANGTLTGSGTVVGNVNNAGGIVAPGNPVGTMAISGNYLQAATGRLRIAITEVGPVRVGGQLDIGGNAALAGTLDLQIVGPYIPALGDTTVLLTAAGGVAGTFDQIDNVVQPGNLGLAVRYSSTEVDVRVSVLGDADFDNDVDTSDLTIGIINFTGASGSGKTWSQGDFDGDGDTDTGDLTTAIVNFTGASAGNPNVPDLVYDPATGNVTIDADGADVISFSLQSGPFNAADFSELPAGLTDNIATQIGWTSFNLFSGLTGTANLGNILPAGLDQAGLEAALTTASYGLALAGGGGGGRLDLVIPEPGTVGLMLLAGIPLLRRRRSA